jgi:hypothetical protein
MSTGGTRPDRVDFGTLISAPRANFNGAIRSNRSLFARIAMVH